MFQKYSERIFDTMNEEILIAALKGVEDPELHLDVWTLGLIYEHRIDEEKKVFIKMTFTSPFCPFGPQLLEEVKAALLDAGASDVEVEITFDPPWKPSEELKEMLGF